MIKHTRSMQGFTLIELMIVVGVIALLAGLAYPAYQDYVLRSDRSDGQAFLNDAAARQERYLAQNNAYADTTAKLGYSSSTSPGKRYTLGISATAATAYTLTATPIRTDSKCGNLTLDQAGTKGKSGSASVDDCWK